MAKKYKHALRHVEMELNMKQSVMMVIQRMAMDAVANAQYNLPGVAKEAHQPKKAPATNSFQINQF